MVYDIRLFIPTYQANRPFLYNLSNVKNVSQPAIPYSETYWMTCLHSPHCAQDIYLAKTFNPSAKQTFDDSQFVYEAHSHAKFCTPYSDYFDEKHPPSITSYISYLQAVEQQQDLYHYLERNIHENTMPLPYRSLKSNSATAKRRNLRRLHDHFQSSTRRSVQDRKNTSPAPSGMQIMNCENNEDFYHKNKKKRLQLVGNNNLVDYQVKVPVIAKAYFKVMLLVPLVVNLLLEAFIQAVLQVYHQVKVPFQVEAQVSLPAALYLVFSQAAAQAHC